MVPCPPFWHIDRGGWSEMSHRAAPHPGVRHIFDPLARIGMAVFGYVRVSTVEQANGTSLEEQRRRISGVALTRGWAIESVYEEVGVSGAVPLEIRSAGRALLAQLRREDTLIVAKLDRAFRSAADALSKAESWRDAGVQLVVADMGPDPVTDTGAAKLFFGMLALVAEFERERILERTSDGRRAKAARGGHVGGTPPFGHRVQGVGVDARLVPVPEQQAALATIRRLHGRVGLRRIATEVERVHGVRISHEGVRRVLAVTTGRSRHRSRSLTNA